MDSIIVVKKLTKNFEVTKRGSGFKEGLRSLFNPQRKTVEALKGISFNIEKGELVGFIGPNGAGKTTTLKILSGLLYPTSGVVHIDGHEPAKREETFLKKISLVMGQKNQMWWDLPAIDTFELIKSIYEINTKDYEDTLGKLSEILGVSDLLTTQVRKMSLGQRMKMELIASLLHRPKILFLDEPTIGLDVVAQQKIRDFIYEYNKKYEATIILTSHNMEDVKNLCKRVIVIDNGQLIYDGDLKNLIASYIKTKNINVTFAKEIDVKTLEDIGTVEKYSYPEATIVVPKDTAAIAASEILASYPISDLTIEDASIEDVVRKIFKGDKK